MSGVARASARRAGRPPKRPAVSAARDVDGAPAAGGRRPVAPGSGRASSGSSLDRASRMTQARWPSAVAAARLRLAGEDGGRRGAVDAWPSSGAPRRAPSGRPARRRRSARGSGRARGGDLGLAAAPAVDERASSRSCCRRAAAPSATGCRRAARARPSDTARARMPLPTGWARLSTVIQSPASRAARRSSCHVRSVSSTTSRSSRPNANQRASSFGSRSSRSAMKSQPDVALARVASRKPALTASISGHRTPWRSPMPGAIRRWPSRYPGSARAARPSREGGGERRPDRRARRRGRGRAPRRRGRRSATRAVARCGDRADRRRASSRAPPGRGSGRGSLGVRPEPVSRLELALALRVGSDVGRRRRREDSPLAGSTMRAAVSTTAAGIGDPALGADRDADRTGRLKSTFIRAVTPQLSVAASDQAMTSSRIVQMIPPWAMPSQPWKRSASASSVQQRSPSTWRSRWIPCSLSAPQAKQWCGATSIVSRCRASTTRPAPAALRRGRSAGRSTGSVRPRRRVAHATSDVKVPDLPGLGLDEVLARRDLLAHEHREDRVGRRGVVDLGPQQRPRRPGSSSSPRAGRRSSRRGP